MYIDLIYISTFLMFFFPVFVEILQGENLSTNVYSCTTVHVYSAER